MKTRKQINDRIKRIDRFISENAKELNKPILSIKDEEEILLDIDYLKSVKNVLKWVLK